MMIFDLHKACDVGTQTIVKIRATTATASKMTVMMIMMLSLGEGTRFEEHRSSSVFRPQQRQQQDYTHEREVLESGDDDGHDGEYDDDDIDDI